jgi:hypothetical protein
MDHFFFKVLSASLYLRPPVLAFRWLDWLISNRIFFDNLPGEKSPAARLDKTGLIESSAAPSKPVICHGGPVH